MFDFLDYASFVDDSSDWTSGFDLASMESGGDWLSGFDLPQMDGGGDLLSLLAESPDWNSGYDLPMGGLSGGSSGGGFLDKILANLGKRWEKDPLAMIGSAVGVLGHIDKMRQAKRGGGGGGGGVAGPTPDQLIAAQAADPYRQANVITPMPPITGRDPGMYVLNGPLSHIIKR